MASDGGGFAIEPSATCGVRTAVRRAIERLGSALASVRTARLEEIQRANDTGDHRGRVRSPGARHFGFRSYVNTRALLLDRIDELSQRRIIPG